MKKTKIFLLLLSAATLLGCSPNVQDMSEAEAKDYGLKLVTKHFNKELYPLFLDLEESNIKYSIVLNTPNKDEINVVNSVSHLMHFYNYSNNELKIADADENEVERIAISRGDFLRDYVGVFSFDFAENDIKTHTTRTEQYFYAKGGNSYYVLEQNIVFNATITLNLKILNNQEALYVNELLFNIKFGAVDFVRFKGHQLIDDVEKDFMFVVDVFPG